MKPLARVLASEARWYYCNSIEIQNVKNEYFSSTFGSSSHADALVRSFNAYVSEKYDVPANGLKGVCYRARPYKPDTFESVEDQRSQHMAQSQKHGQNVMATGWTGTD